jgi:hypothetical protein
MGRTILVLFLFAGWLLLFLMYITTIYCWRNLPSSGLVVRGRQQKDQSPEVSRDNHHHMSTERHAVAGMFCFSLCCHCCVSYYMESRPPSSCLSIVSLFSSDSRARARREGLQYTNILSWYLSVVFGCNKTKQNKTQFDNDHKFN